MSTFISIITGPPPLKRKRREQVCPDAGTITYLQRAWRKRMATLAVGPSPTESSAISALLRAPVLTSDLFDAAAPVRSQPDCEEDDEFPLR